MRKAVVYTDGSCKGNPGDGGWGAVIIIGDDEHEINGGEKRTTNNRMELVAAIKALSWLMEPCEVELYTDSKYLINGITRWIHNWKTQHWKSAAGKTVKSVDLWMQLDQLTARHRISWNWVKGHSGNDFNERADSLARRAINWR